MIDFKRINETQKARQYHAVHREMGVVFGQPSLCVRCGSLDEKRYEWAQIHGTPMVANLDNFMRLCKSCHVKYDNTPETNAKIAATLKAKGISPPSRLGAFISDDAKAKISAAKKGRKPNNYGHRVLSSYQIAEIQERFSPSPGRGYRGGNVSQLATEFGVDRMTITEIGKKRGRFSV